MHEYGIVFLQPRPHERGSSRTALNGLYRSKCAKKGPTCGFDFGAGR
jgi:hypothetical protein